MMEGPQNIGRADIRNGFTMMLASELRLQGQEGHHQQPDLRRLLTEHMAQSGPTF